MKRLLSSLTAACLLIGCLMAWFPAVTFAAEPTSYGEAELVFQLGILDKTKFDPDAAPTRAELTAAVMRAANYPVDAGAAQYFVDVPASHPYAKEINTAVQIGFISPGGALFEPDAPATLPQAAKMLVWACGYDVLAQVQGGYPVGYLVQAAALDITKGVGDAWNYDALLFMLMGALKAEVLEQSQFGSASEYQAIKDRTLLAFAHRIYRVRGVVTEHSAEALPAAYTTPRPRIAIDGVFYELGEMSIPDYLEYRVTAYYKEQNNGDRELYFILPDQRNVTESIDADDITKFNGATLEIDRDGQRETFSINPQARVLYNGEYLSSYDETDIKPAYGRVTLVDPMGDGEFDAVKVSAYQTVVVQGVNADEKRIYSKYGGVTLNLDEKQGVVRITDASGKALTLDDVKSGDVLTAEIGKNGTSRRVTVSSKTVTGVVSEVSEEKGKTQVKIGDQAYLVVPDFAQTIAAGKEAAFCLDANGLIADMQADISASNIALFIRSAVQPGVMADAQVKLFTAEGKMAVLTLSDKLKVDGSMKTDKEALACLGDQRQVVVYKLNKDGKIRELDTTIMGDDEDRSTALIQTVEIDPANKLRYKTASKSFANKMIVDDEAVFFLMPPEEHKLDDQTYEMIGTKYFTNDTYYAIGSYNLGENRGMSDVVTVQLTADKVVSDDTSLFILDHFAEQLTEDGDTCKVMYGYRESAEVQFRLESPEVITNITRKEGDVVIRYQPAAGDVLKLAFNSKNEVSIAEPVYSLAEDRMWTANPTYPNFDHVFRVMMGYVVLRDETIAKIMISDPVGTGGQLDGSEELFNLDKFKIYRVTLDQSGKAAKKIERVEPGDIADFVHNGGSRSRVIFHTRYGEAKTMVVYE